MREPPGFARHGFQSGYCSGEPADRFQQPTEAAPIYDNFYGRSTLTEPPVQAQVCLAEAIYSNVAEYPEELAFERGDVLRVVSQNPGIEGISDGWWLCVDKKGNTGVVPANRLQVMQRFDGGDDTGKGFFEVANPLFGDFFMFGPQNGHSAAFDASPFEDNFFRGSRLFPSSLRDRLADPLRRVNSCDESLKNAGVVRNIPIRIIDQKGPGASSASSSSSAHSPSFVERPFSASLNEPRLAGDRRSGCSLGGLPDFQRRFSDFPYVGGPREIRRTVSSGRVSPPTLTTTAPSFFDGVPATLPSSLNPPQPPTRRFVSAQSLLDGPAPLTSTSTTTTFPASANGDVVGYKTSRLDDDSADDDGVDDDVYPRRRVVQHFAEGQVPQRTLVLPGAVAGRTIEIPLGGSTLSLGSLPSQQRARASAAAVDAASRHSMRSKSPKGVDEQHQQTQMEKLTQRLRNLAGKPFRTLAGGPTSQPNGKESTSRLIEPKKNSDEDARTPSPSSSGICADINDPTSSSEEKRTSDISSLSGSDQNSSLSDNNDDLRSQTRLVPQQPPHASRLTPISDVDFRSTRRMPNGVRPELLHSSSSPLPTSVDEDMRRNRESTWTRIPTKFVGDRGATPTTATNVGDILEDELQARKRVVCNKLVDCERGIRNMASIVAKCTEAQNWRALYILHTNVSTLQNAAATIVDVLEQFIETTGRISVDRTNAKYVELNRQLGPLAELRTTLSAVVRQLDNGGWTLASLARERRDPHSHDALDQLVAIAKKLPDECGRFIEWTQALAPSSSILFLSPSASSNFAPRLPSMHQSYSPAPSQQQQQQSHHHHHQSDVAAAFDALSTSPSRDHNGSPAAFGQPKSLLERAVERPIHLLNAMHLGDEKRLSTSSTSTLGGGGGADSSTSSSSSQPSSILVTQQNRSDKPQRGRVTFADEQPDRSSTGSSIENSSVEYATIQKSPTTPTIPTQSQVQTPILSSHEVPESRIVEEDDLESIVSDRESLFQDYAYLDDVVPGRGGSSMTACGKAMNDEDRQLVRFYSPQLDQHTDALTLAVEEFLATVENNLPPREFVQKGKLIILAAHKLIYIGDSVSQCVRDAAAGDELRRRADALCGNLKRCVQATKTAADEYPDIRCMQSMVDSVMTVSTAAHDLKSAMRAMC